MDVLVVLEQLNCPAIIFDRKGKPQYWNSYASGRDGKPNPLVLKAITKGYKEQSDETVTLPLLKPAGSLLCLYIPPAQGEITRSLNMLSSPPFLKTILNNSEIAITIADSEGTVIMFSQGAERLTGYNAQDVVTLTNIKALYATDAEYEAVQAELRSEGLVRGRAFMLRRQDRSLIKTLNNIAVLRDVDGNAVGTLTVTVDLTREERLRQLAQGMVETLPTGLAAISLAGRVLLCNDAFRRLLRLPNDVVFDQDIFRIAPQLEPHRTALLRVMREGRPESSEREEFEVEPGVAGYRRVTFYPVQEGGKINLIIMRVDDLTGEVQVERLAVSAEKMNAVAGLAAGMAHEINNPLSGIIQSADLIRRSFNLDDPRTTERMKSCGFDDAGLAALRRYLEERRFDRLSANVLTAAERVSRIIGGLLEFSRKKKLARRPWAPRAVVEKVLSLARTDEEMNHLDGIEIIESPVGSSFEVLADLPQLLQVLLHVIRQAKENLEQKRAGFGEATSFRPRLVFSYEQTPSNGAIVVRDNGLFLGESGGPSSSNPFFSTLRTVRGGLGLSVAQFIVKEFLQGELILNVNEREGTVYKIVLPLAS